MLLRPRLTLDRMAIEEAGSNPEKLAEALHRQLNHSTGKVPIEEIATALDIAEIRHEKLESFEGALLTTPERDGGSILVNSRSSLQRRRFTVAHELGHYLNPWHVPNSESGFQCSKKEMGRFLFKPGLSRHEVQELEANKFAIGLLAPKNRIDALSNDDPSIADVLRIAAELDLSKEAAARRYVELHPAKVAAAFTKDGVVRYPTESKSCPRLSLPTGTGLLARPGGQPGLISHEETEIQLPFFNGQRRSKKALVETVYQESGFAISLLTFEDGSDDEDDDEPDVEDSFDRFTRF